MNGMDVEQVDSYKFLGVMIDNNLTWKKHKTYVSKKIVRNIGLLYKARNILSLKEMIGQYNSFVLPYLLYCLPVWGHTVQSKKDPIVKIQNRAMRVIANVSRTVDAIKILRQEILSVKQLHKLELCKLVYDYRKANLPTPVMQIFTDPIDNERKTRTTISHKLRLLNVKTTNEKVRLYNQ